MEQLLTSHGKLTNTIDMPQVTTALGLLARIVEVQTRTGPNSFPRRQAFAETVLPKVTPRSPNARPVQSNPTDGMVPACTSTASRRGKTASLGQQRRTSVSADVSFLLFRDSAVVIRLRFFFLAVRPVVSCSNRSCSVATSFVLWRLYCQILKHLPPVL